MVMRGDRVTVVCSPVPLHLPLSPTAPRVGSSVQVNTDTVCVCACVYFYSELVVMSVCFQLTSIVFDTFCTVLQRHIVNQALV